MKKHNFYPAEYKKNSKFKINHSYLVEQFSDYSKIFKEIEKVVVKGDYTLGQIVDTLEKKFAKRTGAKFGISVGNGTDALFLALIADEIRLMLSSALIEKGISSNLPWTFCQSSWTDLPRFDAYSSKGWWRIPAKIGKPFLFNLRFEKFSAISWNKFKSEPTLEE